MHFVMHPSSVIKAEWSGRSNVVGTHGHQRSTGFICGNIEFSRNRWKEGRRRRKATLTHPTTVEFSWKSSRRDQRKAFPRMRNGVDIINDLGRLSRPVDGLCLFVCPFSRFPVVIRLLDSLSNWTFFNCRLIITTSVREKRGPDTDQTVWPYLPCFISPFDFRAPRGERVASLESTPLRNDVCAVPLRMASGEPTSQP